LDNPREFENINVEYGQDSAYNPEEKAVRIRLEVMLSASDEKNRSLGLNAG
jgi:hypothetical protein